MRSFVPGSKTRAWHRVMPVITVITIPFHVLCMNSTLWKFTAFREVRPAYMWAMTLTLALRTPALQPDRLALSPRLGDLG